MSVATSAAEALKLYEEHFEQDRLTQGDWHTERDGRQLACALGVLGDDVHGPGACPATIMPRWLAQMVPGFFDRQSFDDAKDWGLRFYKALDRIGGNVPFSVIHDWHANCTTDLGVEAAELRQRDTGPHIALKAMHQRALAGEKISADEWRPVLRAAYAYAYANANAYAYADANAYAYADANANAYANAYADANAYAYADANANAYANADARQQAREAAWKRLADGMVDALNRVAIG